MSLRTYPPWGKRFSSPTAMPSTLVPAYRPPDPQASASPGFNLTSPPGAAAVGSPLFTEDLHAPTYSADEHRLQDGRPRGQWEPPEAGIMPRTLESTSTGTGVSVYKWHTDHATAGQYNCYLQTWASADWANVDTTDVVVKNILETSGNAFGTGDYFIAVGAADDDGVVPVIPYGYAHAY